MNQKQQAEGAFVAEKIKYMNNNITVYLMIEGNSLYWVSKKSKATVFASSGAMDEAIKKCVENNLWSILPNLPQFSAN